MIKLISKPIAIQELRNERDFWFRRLTDLTKQEAKKKIREDFTIKDLVAHLMMWQKITMARLVACLEFEYPIMPAWHPPIKDPDDVTRDLINAEILAINKKFDWKTVYSSYQDGFDEVIVLSKKVPETDYFDNKKFPWLFGYNVSDVIKGTILHHREDHRPDLKLALDE